MKSNTKSGISEVLSFDEERLRRALDDLDWRKRALFAAVCAQRLGRCLERYETARDSVVHGIFSEALSAIWSASDSSFDNTSVLTPLYDRCMNALPDDVTAWDAGVPYADDASAAVVFALQSAIEKSVDATVYAARRAYEAIDGYVGAAVNRESGELTEEELLADERVQRELRRQRRDLDELVSFQGRVTEIATLLRSRAMMESDTFFD